MKRLTWFFIGAATFLVVAGSAVFVLLPAFAQGFSTRMQPTALEAWLARRMRHMSVPVSAKGLTNPVPNSRQVLAQARVHWADHCASCHGNNGSGDVAMGRQMYPPAPDMRKPETQTLTDGELFYAIENGIRLTGMPAWGSGSAQDAEDSWKLVRFIRHLPAITAAEEQEMKEMNPKSPDDLREEQEERDFLNGADLHEQTQHQHH
jgi:mono/diheme cytochrome c family protein